MKTILIIACAACLFGTPPCQVGAATTNLSQQRVVMPETPAQKQARLKWWRDARFGMFIHWGPVSIVGTEISWSRNGVGVENYDNLYKQFNPVKFNADEWAATAKAAGMKYVVLTAKHHDGFCLWPTKTTDYNIGNSPFKRDICAELARAVRKAGLKIGWYYSPGDWYDPDCRSERNDMYVKRMQEQIRELLTNYGKIDMIWIDYDGGSSPWDQENTYKLIKTLQPGIIINNRLDIHNVTDSLAHVIGPNADYYTPEQRIGDYDDKRPWETCMTIGAQWSYRPNDVIKSSAECIRALIKCASGDGNLLFNVGPTPLGEIESPQPQRLKEMGDWLKKYGESIYGTRGGPFKPSAHIASTRKGNVIFVQVLRPISGPLSLPAIPTKIKSATLIGGAKVSVRQTSECITLDFPGSQAKPLETVVKLTLDGSAMDIPAVEVPRLATQLPDGAKVAVSNVYGGDEQDWGAEKAFDGNYDTRWATNPGVKQAWLTIEYPQPTQVSSLAVSEEYERVKSFELQYQDGSDWKTVFAGTTIGAAYNKGFEPVTAKTFRLNITESTDGPTFCEIKLK